MKRLPLLAIVALTITAGVALAGVTLDVSYDFAEGTKTVSEVRATIDAVEMGRDVPLAVTGNAHVGVTIEVTGVDDDGTATLRATFGEVEATLLGEQQDAATPAPMELQVTRRGALNEVAADDAAELDLFGSGGVPLDLVVLMAGVVEMPDGPVGVGESWETERNQQIPQVGEVMLRTESRITSITDTEVTVLTNTTASLPDFSTPNPLQEGEITVSNGLLTITDMKRVVDAQTGLVKSAEAVMIFDGAAALGPFPPLPLRVRSSFSIAPEGAQQDG